jgi:hypothetical protein
MTAKRDDLKPIGAAKSRAKPMTCREAAIRVLAETKRAMSAKELVEAMSRRGYWTTPKGKTPHATVRTELRREMHKTGRIIQPARGLYALRHAEVATPSAAPDDSGATRNAWPIALDVGWMCAG